MKNCPFKLEKGMANRIDPSIEFSKEACAMLVKVPRVFLKIVLN